MKYISLIATAFVLYSQSSLAESGNVLFNAQVQSTCTLQVTSNGTMTVSPDLKSMTSKNADASPGTVDISTTGGVHFSVDPTVSATVPVGDSATTWLPQYSMTGAHTVALTSSTSTLADPGASTATVHLTGTKSANDRFMQGAYQATVVVTCE